MKKIIATTLIMTMLVTPLNVLAMESVVETESIETVEFVETESIETVESVETESIETETTYVAVLATENTDIVVDVEAIQAAGEVDETLVKVEENIEVDYQRNYMDDFLILDQDFVGTKYYYDDTIYIPVMGIHYRGNYSDKYYVNIYNDDGERVAYAEGYMSDKAGSFFDDRALVDFDITWNPAEMDCDPGAYWIEVYTTYDTSLKGIVQAFFAMPHDTTNLKAAAGGGNKVNLSWDDACADGYMVYAQKNGVYGYCTISTNNSTVDKKALSSDFNYYWVFPYIEYRDGNNELKRIPGGCASKYAYAKGICPSPTNFKATSVSGGVKLSWNASAGAEGYLIYGIVNGEPYGYIGMTTKGTTFTDKTASKTDWNFYWVFPYHTENNKMITGYIPNYVYGRAK